MPDIWTCLKCGETFGHAYLRKHLVTRCPNCQEPDTELFGIIYRHVESFYRDETEEGADV